MKGIIILLYCVLCVISVYTPSSGGKDTYEEFIDVKVGLSNNISTTYSGIKIGTDLALLNVTLYIDGNYTSECIMKSQCIFPSKDCRAESHVYVITVAPAFNNTNFVVVGYTFDGDACGKTPLGVPPPGFARWYNYYNNSHTFRSGIFNNRMYGIFNI